MEKQKKEYDFFISHASEDKEKFVRPLANELTKLGFKIWYDEFTLKLGDSLFEEISNGIKNSNFGIVVISKDFLKKEWTKKELNGLFSKEIFTSSNIILPIWLEISANEVYEFSPILADKVSLPVNSKQLDKAIEKILSLSKSEKHNSEQIINFIEFSKSCNQYERKKLLLDTENRFKNLVLFQETFYNWENPYDIEDADNYELYDFYDLKKQRELMNLYNLPFNVDYNIEFSSQKVSNYIIKLLKKWINLKAKVYDVYELIFLIDWYHEMDLSYILFGFPNDSLGDVETYDLCFSIPYKLCKTEVTEEKIEEAKAKIFSEYYG